MAPYSLLSFLLFLPLVTLNAAATQLSFLEDDEHMDRRESRRMLRDDKMNQDGMMMAGKMDGGGGAKGCMKGKRSERDKLVKTVTAEGVVGHQVFDTIAANNGGDMPGIEAGIEYILSQANALNDYFDVTVQECKSVYYRWYSIYCGQHIK